MHGVLPTFIVRILQVVGNNLVYYPVIAYDKVSPLMSRAMTASILQYAMIGFAFSNCADLRAKREMSADFREAGIGAAIAVDSEAYSVESPRGSMTTETGCDGLRSHALGLLA